MSHYPTFTCLVETGKPTLGVSGGKKEGDFHCSGFFLN